MEKELVCIVCPMGCRLKIFMEEDGSVSKVEGNSCVRGEVYGRQEVTAPKRMLTTTVKIQGAIHRRLPVVLSGQIPRERIFEVMEKIKSIQVEAPVEIHQILEENICGLGVSVLASRNMGKKE